MYKGTGRIRHYIDSSVSYVSVSQSHETLKRSESTIHTEGAGATHRVTGREKERGTTPAESLQDVMPGQ